MVRYLLLCVVALAATPVLAQPTPSEAEAAAFIERAENELLAAWKDNARASWVQSTYITEDTQILASKASEKATALAVHLAQEAARFQSLELSDDLSRKLLLLRLALTVPAPSNPEETRELARIETSMESTYGAGKYCPDEGECWDLQKMSGMLAGEPRPEAPPRSLARVAHGLCPDARGVRALCRARKQRCARARVRRSRHDVALQIRHAGGRLRGGARPLVGASAAALRLAARLCAHAPPRDLRRRARSGERSHPGAFAREHVGSVMEQCL